MATRRERVILELEDQFSGPITKDAAAVALLKRELGSLSGNSVRASRDIDRVGASSSRSGREIDKFSGRLRVLTDVAAILGPGLIPIGAVGIPAVAGLAAQFGAAAIAGGTALLAFQGVGDTLEAVNTAALEPSAENLEAARIAMQNLSPAARSLIRELQEMQPAFLALRDAAASGLFPGLERGLENLGTVLPNLEDVLFRVGDAAGDVVAELTEGFVGPRGQEFLAFIGREVPGTLTDLGHIVGNLAGGMAELWMAFSPTNRDFSGWMVEAARGFDDWAQGLSRTEGFREFIAYVRANGPRVADAMAALGNALLQIVEAAAPLGGPVLEALTGIANAIAKIAGSDAGPTIMAAVTALALLRRGQAAWAGVAQSSWAQSIRGAETFQERVNATRRVALRGAGALAGLAVASSGVADGMGLSNTASLGLMGTLGGPWGAVIGAGVGLMLDFAAREDEAAAKADALAETLNQQTGAVTRNSREWAKNTLFEDGTFDAAERVGLSLDTLTDAALGNESAIRAVNGAYEQYQRDLWASHENTGSFDARLAEQTDEWEKVKGAVGDTNGTLAEARNKIRQFGEAGSGAGNRAAEGFNRAKSAAEEFRAEVERVNAILERRASFRDYEAAVDDFAKTLRDAGKNARLLNKDGTINITIPKGREVQAALDNIASTAIKVAENLKGTQRIQALNQARRDFIDAAQKLGIGRRAAEELADKLGLLNRTSAKPKVGVDGIDAVQSSLASVSSWLDNLNGKTATTWVTTRHVNVGGMGPQANADGGTILGKRRPYGDKVLTFLAPGEEVISNRYGQADRHRELLKAINANRYANGGTVGRTRVSVGSPSVSLAGAQITAVFPGVGQVVGSIVDARMNARDTYHDRLDDRD